MNEVTDSASELEPFVPLSDLFSQTSTAALASAIEKEGVYTWDRFGRFIKATNGDSADPYSIASALDMLANCRACPDHNIEVATTDVSNGGPITDVSFDVCDTCQLGRFGWPLKVACSINFERHYQEFLSDHHGEVAVPPPPLPKTDPAVQSRYLYLIKGLVVLKYGEGMLDKLKEPRSTAVTTIGQNLASEGFRLSVDTLRKYLKNLPD